MALCLIAAGVAAKIATAAFTLGWSHTVEHEPWREEWQVTDDALLLREVRIKGSGAGMEPPPESRLVDGWYVWHPADARRDEIVLRRAPDPDGVIGDWQLCPADKPCSMIGDLVGADADPVTLEPCR